MLIGFGCTVPAVMGTRTLSSGRDRKMTIMMTPFMSCSAKLPIYAFFSSAFFGKYAWIVMVALYFLGIGVGIIVALISKKFMFKGEPVPFVMYSTKAKLGDNNKYNEKAAEESGVYYNHCWDLTKEFFAL